MTTRRSCVPFLTPRSLLQRSALLALVCGLLGVFAYAQPRTGSLDLVIILDTSASMVGQAGGVDIFDKVQSTCTDLVGDLRQGDTVTLISYDENVDQGATITLHSDTERERVAQAIKAIVADGKRTFTSKALQVGLEEADRLDGIFPDHRKVVVILTDGRNNPPPGAPESGLRLGDVTAPYGDKPWYVYQVQLGPEIDQELAAALERLPNGRTIHDREGAQLDSLRDRILPTPEPAPTHEVFEWNPRPDRIVLNVSEAGRPASGSFEVGFPDNLPAAAVEVSPDWSELPSFLDVSISQEPSRGKLELTVTALVNEAGKSQEARGTVRVALTPTTTGFLAAPVSVPVTIRVDVPPPPDPKPVWLWPLLIGVAVALIGGLALWFRRPKPLFGELEVWNENGSGTRLKHDLSLQGSKCVIGPDGAPASKADGSIAKLDLKKESGDQIVRVVPSTGNVLKFKGEPVGELLLHNRDEFFIAHLGFRYLGGTTRSVR